MQGSDGLMENRSNHVLVGGVVLVLIGLILAFTVWMASAGGSDDRKYDILFKTSVDGLAKGSAVTFSGVPVGKVEDISLLPDQPELIRVRIQVKRSTPVLQGISATIAGVGFTGVSQINLALLNNAPQLLERLTTLTERLTDLLNPQNQRSISGILTNIDKVSGSLANRSGDIAATFAEAHKAIAQAGDAAEKLGNMAEHTDTNLQPVLANLNDAVASAKHTLANIDSTVESAKPGLKALSVQTIPAINQLVRDLSETAGSLSALSGKIDSGGASGLIGAPRLPDYQPRKK
jgi:phospholipid/cholesterol/gamma-HCH transport system substrate-binding protein